MARHASGLLQSRIVKGCDQKCLIQRHRQVRQSKLNQRTKFERPNELLQRVILLSVSTSILYSFNSSTFGILQLHRFMSVQGLGEDWSYEIMIHIFVCRRYRPCVPSRSFLLLQDLCSNSQLETFIHRGPGYNRIVRPRQGWCVKSSVAENGKHRPE